jgi:uncharacterized protein involved in cysteine biosynthesis
VSLVLGLTIPLRAARLAFTKPRLLAACLIPWILSGVLSYFFIQQASQLALMLLGWAATALGISVGGVLAQILGWTLAFLSWIAGALLLVWGAAILAIPFADWLSELAEPFVEPKLATSTADLSWFSRAQWRRIRIDAAKTFVSLVISLLGMVLSSIPLLGVLGPAVIALGIAFQFLGYPQTRRNEGVTVSLLFVIRNLPLCLGFGLILLPGFAVPFLSAFLFPIAVIGGTLLYGAGKSRQLPAPEDR